MGHGTNEHYDLKITVVTVSSSKSLKDDITGRRIAYLFKENKSKVARKICQDDSTQILKALICDEDSDVFVFCGGTGPSKLDLTVQTIRKIADKEIVGFGELFRAKSVNIFNYLSNATLFVYGKKAIFCIPGSPEAVDVAFPLIWEMMHHLHHELIKE